MSLLDYGDDREAEARAALEYEVKKCLALTIPQLDTSVNAVPLRELRRVPLDDPEGRFDVDLAGNPIKLQWFSVPNPTAKYALLTVASFPPYAARKSPLG
jgi:hypothetical protein